MTPGILPEGQKRGDLPLAAGSSSLRNGSEQRPNTRGHGHRQCTPERDAYRAHHHAGAACVGGQSAQEREERQRHTGDGGSKPMPEPWQ